MRWGVRRGDILDVPADVLVCSANVFLTLSGGVGGAYLLRYGSDMQDALNRHLEDRGVRHVRRGEVVAVQPCGGPYAAVLHAVAVDGMYESSAEVVGEVVAESLSRAAEMSARSVALTALATGYGRLPMTEFARGLSSVVGREFPPLERVVIGVRSEEDEQALLAGVPGMERE